MRRSRYHRAAPGAIDTQRAASGSPPTSTGTVGAHRSLPARTTGRSPLSRPGGPPAHRRSCRRSQCAVWSTSAVRRRDRGPRRPGTRTFRARPGDLDPSPRAALRLVPQADRLAALRQALRGQGLRLRSRARPPSCSPDGEAGHEVSPESSPARRRPTCSRRLRRPAGKSGAAWPAGDCGFSRRRSEQHAVGDDPKRRSASDRVAARLFASLGFRGLSTRVQARRARRRVQGHRGQRRPWWQLALAAVGLDVVGAASARRRGPDAARRRRYRSAAAGSTRPRVRAWLATRGNPGSSGLPAARGVTPSQPVLRPTIRSRRSRSSPRPSRRAQARPPSRAGEPPAAAAAPAASEQAGQPLARRLPR